MVLKIAYIYLRPNSAGFDCAALWVMLLGESVDVCCYIIWVLKDPSSVKHGRKKTCMYVVGSDRCMSSLKQLKKMAQKCLASCCFWIFLHEHCCLFSEVV